MKRLIVGATAAVGLTLGMASTASAHYRDIRTPSGHTSEHGWVGSPIDGIPGQGEGLILGGPEGTTTLSPSHDGGLVAACEAIREHGNGVVDIYGPYIPGLETCRHGGQ